MRLLVLALILARRDIPLPRDRMLYIDWPIRFDPMLTASMEPCHA
jgi:hypothetical protein